MITTWKLEYRFALMTFFIVCSIVGVTLSWNKTSGGETVTWAGFELLHRGDSSESRKGEQTGSGSGQRKLRVLVLWTWRASRKAWAESCTSRGHWSTRGLFSGPLYLFVSSPAVPPYVSFFLRHLAAQVLECRHHHCSMKMFSDQLAPRVDAQASSDGTGLGGWLPCVDQSGKVNVKSSRWFSLEITRDEWPWIVERSSKPALMISTLEALAVVVALKVYCGETPKKNRSSIRIVPTTTDNRGNGAALNKLVNPQQLQWTVLQQAKRPTKRLRSLACQ